MIMAEHMGKDPVWLYSSVTELDSVHAKAIYFLLLSDPIRSNWRLVIPWFFPSLQVFSDYSLFLEFPSAYRKHLNQLEEHTQGYEATIDHLETKLTQAKKLQERQLQLETSPGHIFELKEHFLDQFPKLFFFIIYGHLIQPNLHRSLSTKMLKAVVLWFTIANCNVHFTLKPHYFSLPTRW